MAKKKKSLQVNAFTLFFVLLSLVLTVFVVRERVIYRSDAKSLSTGGLGGSTSTSNNNFYTAGITCSTYYLQAQDGVAEADFFLRESEPPYAIISQKQLRVEATKPGYLISRDELWNKDATSLDGIFVAEYRGWYEPSPGGPVREFDESRVMECYDPGR